MLIHDMIRDRVGLTPAHGVSQIMSVTMIAAFRGKTALIVEDQTLIAMDMESMLQDVDDEQAADPVGAFMVGACRLDRLARRQPFDREIIVGIGELLARLDGVRALALVAIRIPGNIGDTIQFAAHGTETRILEALEITCAKLALVKPRTWHALSRRRRRGSLVHDEKTISGTVGLHLPWRRCRYDVDRCRSRRGQTISQPYIVALMISYRPLLGGDNADTARAVARMNWRAKP